MYARSSSLILSSEIYREFGPKCFHRTKWNSTLLFLLSRQKNRKRNCNILKVITELNAYLKPSFPLPFLPAWLNHEKCKMASRHFTRVRRQRGGWNTWQPDISHSLVQFFLLQFLQFCHQLILNSRKTLFTNSDSDYTQGHIKPL